MSDIRLVPAHLLIEFEVDEDKNEAFFKEFSSITHNEEDQLGAWLKRAKARGDTKESDQVLLTLIVELHRKFDELSSSIKNESKNLLNLKEHSKVGSIGFEHLALDEDKFIMDKIYYARVDMPIFPKRTMAMYLKALDSKTARIINMHGDDECEWSAYVTARERVMIRQMREG